MFVNFVLLLADRDLENPESIEEMELAGSLYLTQLWERRDVRNPNKLYIYYCRRLKWKLSSTRCAVPQPQILVFKTLSSKSLCQLLRNKPTAKPKKTCAFYFKYHLA